MKCKKIPDKKLSTRWSYFGLFWSLEGENYKNVKIAVASCLRPSSGFLSKLAMVDNLKPTILLFSNFLPCRVENHQNLTTQQTTFLWENFFCFISKGQISLLTAFFDLLTFKILLANCAITRILAGKSKNAFLYSMLRMLLSTTFIKNILLQDENRKSAHALFGLTCRNPMRTCMNNQILRNCSLNTAIQM